jgi:hypothetical protein
VYNKLYRLYKEKDMADDNVQVTQEQVQQVADALKNFQFTVPANVWPFVLKVAMAGGYAAFEAAVNELPTLDFGPNTVMINAVLTAVLSFVKNFLHVNVPVPSPTPTPPAPGGGSDVNVDVGTKE